MLPDHYGEIQCVKVTSPDHFFMILDELGDEVQDKIKRGVKPLYPTMKLPGGFYHNREWILEAYKDERLFGLQIVENDAMFADKASRHDNIFMKRHQSWPFGAKDGACHVSYSLPCFAIVNSEAEERECFMLWVAERARGLGFGSKLVADCGVTWADEFLPESRGFWERNNFQLKEQKLKHGCKHILVKN